MRPDGIFTIENRETGEFRTFKLESRVFDPRQGEDSATEKRVLSYLRGPSNSSDFEDFAFVFGEGPATAIRVWSSKKGKGHEKYRSSHERFATLLSAIFTSPDLRWRERYAVLDSIACRRCGERLTVPESIKRGIGPVCLTKE